MTTAADALGPQEIPAPDALVLDSRPLREGSNSVVLSRYRDDIWDLGPALHAPHYGACRIHFGQIHPDFRGMLKHLCWLMVNHDGSAVSTRRLWGQRPAILTIWGEFKHLRAFTDWLASRGHGTLSAVSHRDLDDYLAAVKTSGASLGKQQDMLMAVIRVWAYRQLLTEPDRLPEAPPWDGEKLHHLLDGKRSQELSTKRVPPAIMNPLLAWSLRFVEELAPDITAAVREYQRLAGKTRPGPACAGRYRRERGEVAQDLQALVRAFRRLRIALPGHRSGSAGELDYHYNYLARLLGADPESLKQPGCRAVLRGSGLPIREGTPLLLTVSGLIDGRPWRAEPIDEREVRALARHLIAACFVVVAYLSGMRPGEVLSLERGCLRRDPDTGMLLISGRHWKGVRDDTGDHNPHGEVRPDPWVVTEPVAAAIDVLQSLHDESLLFPNRLGARADSAQRFRDGRSSTTGRVSRDLDALRDWVNHYCEATGRSDTIPIDPEQRSIQPRQFRRTLAWFIARKPRGIVAAAIQYGHLKVQMTVGYAGTYACGFPDELAFEELLARLDNLAEAHQRLTSGEHVSGPAAELYRDRVHNAQRFTGHVLATHRDARKLYTNPDLQIFPGVGMTCVFDPQRAACRFSRDDTDSRRTPDLSDCQPYCANIARTDGDIEVLREHVQRLAQLVDDPLAPEPRTQRDRHELRRLRTMVLDHDNGRTAPHD